MAKALDIMQLAANAEDAPPDPALEGNPTMIYRPSVAEALGLDPAVTEVQGIGVCKFKIVPEAEVAAALKDGWFTSAEEAHKKAK